MTLFECVWIYPAKLPAHFYSGISRISMRKKIKFKSQINLTNVYCILEQCEYLQFNTMTTCNVFTVRNFYAQSLIFFYLKRCQWRIIDGKCVCFCPDLTWGWRRATTMTRSGSRWSDRPGWILYTRLIGELWFMGNTTRHTCQQIIRQPSKGIVHSTNR